jgi:hypothetical protein
MVYTGCGVAIGRVHVSWLVGTGVTVKSEDHVRASPSRCTYLARGEREVEVTGESRDA